MPADIRDLSNSLSAAFARRASKLKKASRYIRMVLLVGGAALASIAQFATFGPTGPNAWQLVGIFASVGVFIGALFSAVIDEDASEELALAHKAVEDARYLRDEYQALDKIDDEFTKAVELLQVMNLCRGVIERAAGNTSIGAKELVAAMLRACERPAPIAAGFAQHHQWTICIYQAEMDALTGKVMLVCIAHHRAIKCDLTNARQWEAGTGIAGSAYANRDEIVIPDLQTTGLRAVFGTSANQIKPDDVERYRSMVAVPIMVDGSLLPWGVVTATNDQLDHFEPQRRFGIQPVECVRALASMAALAIATRVTPRISASR